MASKLQHRDDAGRACVPNIIDGKPVLLSSSASFPVTSARTQEVLHYGQTASVEIATRAVDSAALTFKTYKITPVYERRRLLLRAAELFEGKVAEATKRQMRETSCDETWAKYTAMQVSTFCREVAGAIASALVGDIQPSYFGFTHLAFKEPVGPVLLIPPWNAAVVLCVRGIANALAAGCTVVVKASELCPWTHQLVVETFHEAGFPPGAVNMIMADRPAGAVITEAVIAHESLRKIEFIGSVTVGKILGGVAAKHLKPIIMELGDQSPAIVLDDADLVNAAELCAQGATMHHGQVCFSTERIIVQSSVQDEFARLLVAAVQRTPLTAVAISNAHAEKAKASIDDAISGGAKFLFGNGEMSGPASMAPSILTNVGRDSLLSNSEAFAPTAFLMAVDSEEGAIAEANSRLGGLSASVFTGSYERGLRVSRELEFGMVQVNNMTLFAEPSGPATCFKGSGWGSNNGRYGIDNFLYNKAVSLVSPSAKLLH
ncbi:Aldehyde/histidinol dehydrogenase [Usnea florida]